MEFQPKNLGKIDIKSKFILNKNYPLLFRMTGHGITKKREATKSMILSTKKYNS